jgi:hypothetical protein
MNRKGSPGAAIKLLPCGHEVMGSSPGNSCRNAGKGCVHKTQSGRTLHWTLRKRELRAPGSPLYGEMNGNKKHLTHL